jgi:DNA-binding NtrC family response regulator
VIIAHNILTRLEIDRGQIGQILNVEYIAALERMAWPGNVRELRNALERRVAFADAEPDESLPTVVAAGASAIEITESRYEAARSQTLAAFERAFVASLLARHDGNVTKAAEAAGIGRVHFHRLMRRHGVRQQVR